MTENGRNKRQNTFYHIESEFGRRKNPLNSCAAVIIRKKVQDLFGVEY